MCKKNIQSMQVAKGRCFCSCDCRINCTPNGGECAVVKSGSENEDP